MQIKFQKFQRNFSVIGKVDCFIENVFSSRRSGFSLPTFRATPSNEMRENAIIKWVWKPEWHLLI